MRFVDVDALKCYTCVTLACFLRVCVNPRGVWFLRRFLCWRSAAKKNNLVESVTFCFSESGFTRLLDSHDCRVISINFSIHYI